MAVAYENRRKETVVEKIRQGADDGQAEKKIETRRQSLLRQKRHGLDQEPKEGDVQ